MLPVGWNWEARADLAEILGFIAARNPDAADRLDAVIQTATLRLTNHPYMGREGRRAGTRELVVHPNYIVVYSVSTDLIRIVNVIHARQQYP